MEYKNEHQRQMAILEAALPYMASGNRHAIQILLQTDSLIHLAGQRTSETSDSFALEAAGLDAAAVTPESRTQEMLHNIRQFLTPREAELAQTIQNFLSAQKLFQNYREFMHSQDSLHEGSPELSAASSQNTANPMQMLFQLINGLGALGGGLGAVNASGGSSQNNLMKDFLLSQLNPEQKAAFEQLQNIMYNN